MKAFGAQRHEQFEHRDAGARAGWVHYHEVRFCLCAAPQEVERGLSHGPNVQTSRRARVRREVSRRLRVGFHGNHLPKARREGQREEPHARKQVDRHGAGFLPRDRSHKLGQQEARALEESCGADSVRPLADAVGEMRLTENPHA